MKKTIVRVRSGVFADDALTANLASGEVKIPWQDMEFVSFGTIHERAPDVRSEMSGMRKKMRQVLLGEDKHAQKKVQHVKATYLIDVFLKHSRTIYRFDSAYINYKSFLGEAEFISLNNFKKFINKLNEYLSANDVERTPDFQHFMEKKPYKVSLHESVFDFEIYNAHYRKKIAERRFHHKEQKQEEHHKHAGEHAGAGHHAGDKHHKHADKKDE